MSRLEFGPGCSQQQLLQDNKANCSTAAEAVSRALQAEQDLGYMVASGRYWEHAAEFDKTKLSDIDSLWLQAINPAPSRSLSR